MEVTQLSNHICTLGPVTQHHDHGLTALCCFIEVFDQRSALLQERLTFFCGSVPDFQRHSLLGQTAADRLTEQTGAEQRNSGHQIEDCRSC